MVTTCCFPGRVIRVKAVRSHHLKIWTFEVSLRKKKRDQLARVQFCFLLEYSPTQMYTLMKTVYGNDVLGCATIFCWHAFFAGGRALAAALLRSGQLKMSSTEIMVNMIEAIIMEDRSLTVRELGAVFDNFCMSSLSSVKFGRGEFKQVLCDLLLCSFYAYIQGKILVDYVKLIRLHGVFIDFMQLFPFAVIFVAVSLFFWTHCVHVHWLFNKNWEILFLLVITFVTANEVHQLIALTKASIFWKIDLSLISKKKSPNVSVEYYLKVLKKL